MYEEMWFYASALLVVGGLMSFVIGIVSVWSRQDVGAMKLLGFLWILIVIGTLFTCSLVYMKWHVAPGSPGAFLYVRYMCDIVLYYGT